MTHISHRLKEKNIYMKSSLKEKRKKKIIFIYMIYRDFVLILMKVVEDSSSFIVRGKKNEF
jgi:hypothetical protein